MNEQAEILCWDVDLPVDNVFISPVSIVGQNNFLVKNPRDVQAFIEGELVDADVNLAKTKAQAKMQLDCRIIILPMHECKVSPELLQANTEYSSIVVEIQLKQEDDEQCRQPYYDRSDIHPEPNEKVISGIKKCLTSLLPKLHSKKNTY